MQFNPIYECDGNYKTTAQYPGSITKEVDSMVLNKVIRSTLITPGDVVHPIGAVVKGSDKTRAMAILGLEVYNQTTLDAANVQLLEKGLKK